jgi:hypothetical protein
MKITVEVEIFDDPEYCESTKNDGYPKCEYLIRSGYCHLFGTPKTYSALKYIPLLAVYKKCDQCKESYQNEILKREAELS